MSSRRGFIKWSADAGTWLRTSDADTDPAGPRERGRSPVPVDGHPPEEHRRGDSIDQADTPHQGPPLLPGKRHAAPSPPDGHEHA